MKSLLFLFIILIIGMAIGIVSQRIPEIKNYTDQMIQPIENSDLWKEWMMKLRSIKDSDLGKKWMMKMGYQEKTADATEPYPAYSQLYTPENSLPGQPISSFLIHRAEYSLAYDAHHRNPAWVYEHLTEENSRGHIEDPYSKFKEDKNIPEHLRTTLADYKSRSLERGQMASPLNHVSNQQAMSETFYLTNLCPQCPQLNQGYWTKLEQHIRSLTRDYPHIYVVTGPLYLPYDENGNRFVKYRVIGPHDVAVPSHFFKVLVLENKEGNKEMLAYILPNYEISLDTPLDTFRTSVQKVEKAAGIVFQ